MRRALRVHPFIAVGSLLGLAAAFLLVAPLLAGTPQRVNMAVWKGTLMRARRDYANTGSLTNFGGDVWLSSNTATIGGTQYQYFLQLRPPRFSAAGTLALTTDLAFIWLETNGISIIIPTNYSPPFLGY